MRVDQARLLVLKAAWTTDEMGNQPARDEIHAIKIAAPRAVEQVVIAKAPKCTAPPG